MQALLARAQRRHKLSTGAQGVAGEVARLLGWSAGALGMPVSWTQDQVPLAGGCAVTTPVWSPVPPAAEAHGCDTLATTLAKLLATTHQLPIDRV